MTLLGLLSLVLGLSTSYFLYTRGFENKSVTKTWTSILAVYLSLITVLGFYIDFFGLPVSTTTYFFIFMISGIGGYYYLQPERPKIEWKLNKYVLLIIAAGFIYLAYPSFPSMFPAGSMPDAPRHYAIAQYIQDKGRLIHPGSGEALSLFGSSIIETYPFGTHLNTALLSSMLDIQLIRILFPFHAILLVLSAVVLYGIAVEYLSIDEKLALIVPFVFLTSLHNIEALTYTNSFSMITGGFLAISFFWNTLDYLDAKNIRKILILALILSAMFMTYPIWAFLGFIAFILSSFLHNNKIEKDHIWFLIIGALILTVLYWRDKFNAVSSPLSTEGVLISTPYLATGLGAIALSIMGAYTLEKKHKSVLAFLLSTAALPIFFVFYSQVFSHVSLYWYYKTYYHLGYPLALLAGAGLSKAYHEVKAMPVKNKENTRNLFLLFLVIAGVFSLYQLQYVQEKRWNKLSITPDEFTTGLELRKMPGDLFFMHPTKADKERPRIYWLVALSQKNANPNGVLLVDDESEITSTHLAMFEVIHREGKTVILRRKGS